MQVVLYKMGNIGVVLVNYHKDEEIISITKKYEAYNSIAKIIIVNNDYKKNSDKLSQISTEKVIVINHKENLGYSKGNNIGIKYLINNYQCNQIIISNSDIEIDEETIVKLSENLNEYKNILGAIAPRMKNEFHKVIPLRYIPLNFLRIFLRIFFSENFIDRCSERFIEHDKNIYYQSFLPGSFFMVNTEAMLRSGCFDENIFLYREEEILGKRMNEKGFKLGILHDRFYIHNHKYSSESLKYLTKHLEMVFKSEKYYFDKYINSSIYSHITVAIFQKLYLYTRCLKKIMR